MSCFGSLLTPAYFYVNRYEQRHYSALSHTRSDVGPKPYGCGNYCKRLPISCAPCPQN